MALGPSGSVNGASDGLGSSSACEERNGNNEAKKDKCQQRVQEDASATSKFLDLAGVNVGEPFARALSDLVLKAA